jgi:hypothetical protein
MWPYQVPRPPSRQRITPAALTALQAQLQAPHGFAGYAQIRTWLAEQHQVYLSYSGVYALVRGKLRAKPKRPRPSHAKKVLRLSPSFKQSSQRSSDSSANLAKASFTLVGSSADCIGASLPKRRPAVSLPDIVCYACLFTTILSSPYPL